MNTKSKILFLILFFCSQAVSVNYPSPTGYVNDFAKILPEKVRSGLEQKLSDYEKQTSIEIAVVTTPSLDGMTIEDWTIGLATNWGVGKKGKDNGLVIAVAPNERKIKIEVGYGLEGDLPDGKCGRILDEFAIPNFKNKNYTEGITSTVGEIIRQLGIKTAEERAAEKARIEEQKRIDQERDARIVKWMGLVFLIVGVLAVIIGMIVSAYNRRQREIREAEEMKKEVEESLENLPKKITQLKKEHTKSMEVLETIKRENPRENWEALVSSAATIAGIFVAAVGLLESARKKNTAEKIELVKAHVDIRMAKEKLSKVEKIFADISSRQKEIKDAKEGYGKTLEKAEEKVKKALELAENAEEKDSEKEAKKKANEAKEKLDEAKRLASGSGLINWLAVALLIADAMSLCEEAKRVATYVSSNIGFGSSPHSSFDGFGSSPHSSFGGFGGGSFGGGGASRGW